MAKVRGRRASPLAAILWADAALELVGAAALLLWRDELRAWLGLGAATLPLAALFVVGAPAVALLIVTGSRRELVRALALGNLGAGLAGWAFFLVTWSSLEAEGRWIGPAASDTFLVLGVLELLALRRAPAA